MSQWRRRRKSQSAINRTKSKVSQKSSQFVSQKLVSQPKVPWRSQIFGTEASSKEVPVSRKPKKVERQPQVELVGQPETSQSAGSALAATIRWVSCVVEGSPCQTNTEKVESQALVESFCQPETIQSAGGALAATKRSARGVDEGSPSQPKTKTSPKSAISRFSLSARYQSVSRKCLGGKK